MRLESLSESLSLKKSLASDPLEILDLSELNNKTTGQCIRLIITSVWFIITPENNDNIIISFFYQWQGMALSHCTDCQETDTQYQLEGCLIYRDR